jgi:hypothetical protein
MYICGDAHADAANMPLATGRGGFMGLGLGLGLGLGFGTGFSGIYPGNGDHHLAIQVLSLKSQCMVHIESTYTRTLIFFF